MIRRILTTLWIGGLAMGAAVGAEPVHVVATTTIIGDVVAQIGGDEIDLTVLFPVGADPHAFEATPQDAAAIWRADIVFANGLSLEEALSSVLSNAQGRLVALAETVPERPLEGDAEHGAGADPHVWLDPANVIVWAEVIAAVLSEEDPENADRYADRARAYAGALRALDESIADALSAIPDERRRLVTDHAVLGHFAARYGFEQVGAVLPGFSTLADPSAREIAQLEERIRSLGVPAIFVGTTVRPELADRIAADTQTAVVPLYTGSLSAPDGPAATYIDLMRYNVAAIVGALGGAR